MSTRYIDEDEATGSEMLRSHSMDMPAYDIGWLVEYPNSKKELVTGEITAYNVSTCIDNEGYYFQQVMYTIDNGTDEIMEDDVVSYVEPEEEDEEETI